MPEDVPELAVPEVPITFVTSEMSYEPSVPSQLTVSDMLPSEKDALSTTPVDFDVFPSLSLLCTSTVLPISDEAYL